MSYRFDKEDNSIVVDGWERGIAASPMLGIANMQCTNISTVPKEVLCSYARARDTQDYTVTATLTEQIVTTSEILYSTNNGSYLYAGSWVSITNSTISNLSNGTYYIISSSQSGTKQLQLSATYNGTPITPNSGNANTATLAFLANTANTGGIMAKPVQGVTEFYTDASGNSQNRYYVLDQEGHVWVKDTGVNTVGIEWAQIDTKTARSVASLSSTAMATGLAVYNGWLFLFIQNAILCKFTAQLGKDLTQSDTSPSGTPNGWAKPSGIQGLNTPAGINNPHFALSSKSGALYYADAGFVGSIFANNQTATNPNLFSYGSYTVSVANPGVFTVTNLIGGVNPYINMPISFYSSAGTSGLPAASGGGLTTATTYYVKTVSTASGIITFTISATVGGSAIQITGAGSGTQYYTTFDPAVTTSYVFSPQALTIPQQQDIAQCLADLGSQILIGCQSNTLYFWDGVAITPNGFLYLPEQNTVNMIVVNNMAYLFSGSRGNIYITNGNTASLVVTVPDYITQTIDPYFTWGGAIYARGRVWFSIQDQTASKTGYCGGIWSFVPTQNLFIGQDSGLSLRQEHQSSYGTYNGMANVLINIQNQNANGLQYFSAWTSDAVSPTYGIDASSSLPYTGGQTVIETDLIPIGNYIEKGNFTSILTKYDAKLAVGESVQLKYRNDITSAWQSFTDVYSGTDSTTGSLGLRFSAPFALQMQVQLQIILTSTASNPSFVRFKELRIKK